MSFADAINPHNQPLNGRPCRTCQVVNRTIGGLDDDDHVAFLDALDSPAVGFTAIHRALRSVWADPDAQLCPSKGSVRNCMENHAIYRVGVAA
jgi:hypothetical protein